MKDQDAWPLLPLAIYLDTIKDRNGKGLTEPEEVKRIHRRTVQKGP